MPHGHCYLWQTPLVSLHVASDSLIAIAYFSIPAMLLYFIYRRRDVPFLNVFILFGAFIILCGLGHLIEVWTLWHPAYWLSGIEQALTALVSCYTAASMVTLLPQFLSLKSPEELEAINRELQKEVRRRQHAEENLRQTNRSLEVRVRERTNALETANQILSDREERVMRQQKILLELAMRTSWYDGTLDRAFQDLTHLAAIGLNVDRASIWLFDNDRTALHCQHLYDRQSRAGSPNLSIQTRDYPDYFEALTDNLAIDTADARQDPRTQAFEEDYLTPLGITAILDIPIRYRNSVVGVVCIEHRGGVRQWEIDEKNFVSYLAYLVTLTLESCDRRATQAALEKSQHQLEEAQRLTHLGSFEIDLVSGQMQISAEACRIHRWSEDKPFNLRSFLKLIHPSDRSRCYEALRTALDLGRFAQLQYRLQYPDGEIRYIDGRLESEMNLLGRVIKLYGAAIDVTERQLAQLRLHQRFRQEQMVATTLQKVWTSHDLEDILQMVVDEVRNFLNVDRVVVYGFQPDWSGDILAESITQPELSLLGQSFEDECFRDDPTERYLYRRVRAISNVETSDLTDCHKDLLRGLQVRANLVVSVFWQPSTTSQDREVRLWGLIIAHSCQEVRQWETFEIEAVQQLSVQLGIALRQQNLVTCLQDELLERQQAEAALRESEAQERSKARELARTLDKLQNTQAKLVQSEKMAALGQMVGGIAHEINNPLSFIVGNIDHAREYAEELLSLLELYRDRTPTTDTEIAAKLEMVDLDFVKEDFPQLLDSMNSGADRIEHIVLSLRNFSRLGQDGEKNIDLHQSIEQTLTVLHNRLSQSAARPSIRFVKQFGDIPQITCSPGHLNQALLSLLVNAIDALEERSQHDPDFRPELEITTAAICQLDRPHEDIWGVAITITDNGIEIPDAALDKIFDPFFTTKPVGKGTGLGLSNAYQIVVEQHGGSLRCYRDDRQRKVFVMEIPRSPAVSPSPAMLKSVS